MYVAFHYIDQTLSESFLFVFWVKEQGTASKLWTADPYVIGAAGCVRTNQILKHFTSWPKYRADEVTDLEAFTVKEIVPALFAACADKAILRTTHGQNHMDNEMVLAWGDHLYSISGNGAVVADVTGRTAAGSGRAEAVGYLGDKGPWTIEQVCEAAQRATLTNLGCSGPIDYVTTIDKTVTRWEP